MFNWKLKGAVATVSILLVIGAGSLACSGDEKKDATPAAEKGKVDEQTMRALIKQLGDESYAKREAASKALTAIGEPALDLLHSAANDASDAEIRTRARNVARIIGSAYFHEVRLFEGLENFNAAQRLQGCGR